MPDVTLEATFELHGPQYEAMDDEELVEVAKQMFYLDGAEVSGSVERSDGENEGDGSHPDGQAYPERDRVGAERDP